MTEGNASLDILLSDDGGNGESTRNHSAAIEYRSSAPARRWSSLPAGVKKAAAIALLTTPLGSASIAGLLGEGGLGFGPSAPISVAAEAYSTPAAGRGRLARLKAERFSTEGRETRITRALQMLATIPDSIQLTDEDARWIAENPDLEDF